MNEKGLLGKRRNRSIATILSYKEQNCDMYLSDEAAAGLRKVILDEINSLCELVFDIVDEQVIFNESYFTMLEEIHEVITDKE